MQAVHARHLSGSRPRYSVRLDFADPVQHRHFLSQLAAAGVTATKFPQLFRLIEETRQAHVKRGRLSQIEDDTCPQDTVCPVNELTTFGSPVTNPLNMSATALSSIPANPYVAMNVVGLYDQNGVVFAGPSHAAQNGGGYDVVNAVNGTAPSSSQTVTASGVWYYQPQGGGGVPGSLYAAARQGNQPDIQNTSPTNVKGNNKIKVCVTRQDADCDYFYAAVGNQFIVRFPLQGTVTYPAAIQADGNGHPQGAFYTITISQPNPSQGGGCVPLPIQQPFLNFTTVSNNVVSWVVDPAQFGVATPCFPSNSPVTFDLMLTVFDVNQSPWLITITSQQGAPLANVLRIDPMVVVYGCVAEGTLVTMADDTTKPIETIRAGERIRSNARRLPLTVDNYTKGYEKPPMYALATANGRKLLATEGHPVITASGIKTARQLVVGDVLITDAGHSKLVSVARRKYDGNVWNLDVGRPADRVRLTDTNTTFYANGILVGDGQMQGRLDRVRYESSEQVLRRLDPRWHIDFRNNEAMRRERQRQGGQ